MPHFSVIIKLIITSTKEEVRLVAEAVIGVDNEAVDPVKSSLLGELVTLARDSRELKKILCHCNASGSTAGN